MGNTPAPPNAAALGQALPRVSQGAQVPSAPGSGDPAIPNQPSQCPGAVGPPTGASGGGNAVSCSPPLRDGSTVAVPAPSGSTRQSVGGQPFPTPHPSGGGAGAGPAPPPPVADTPPEVSVALLLASPPTGHPFGQTPGLRGDTASLTGIRTRFDRGGAAPPDLTLEDLARPGLRVHVGSSLGTRPSTGPGGGVPPDLGFGSPQRIAAEDEAVQQILRRLVAQGAQVVGVAWQGPRGSATSSLVIVLGETDACKEACLAALREGFDVGFSVGGRAHLKAKFLPQGLQQGAQQGPQPRRVETIRFFGVPFLLWLGGLPTAILGELGGLDKVTVERVYAPPGVCGLPHFGHIVAEVSMPLNATLDWLDERLDQGHFRHPEGLWNIKLVFPRGRLGAGGGRQQAAGARRRVWRSGSGRPRSGRQR